MHQRSQKRVVASVLLTLVLGSLYAFAQPQTLWVPPAPSRNVPQLLPPQPIQHVTNQPTGGVVLLAPEFFDDSSNATNMRVEHSEIVPPAPVRYKNTSAATGLSNTVHNPVALLSPIELNPDGNVASNRPLSLGSRFSRTSRPSSQLTRTRQPSVPAQTASRRRNGQIPLHSISQSKEKVGETETDGDDDATAGEESDDENTNDEESKEAEPYLPPLEQELWDHGGSYMYQAEGDRWGWPGKNTESHHHYRRLPENWQKPRPLTAYQEFLGADAVHPRPGLEWHGNPGFHWEPRFVGYGSYQIFGQAFNEGKREQHGIGHQLLIDLDLRLTGTERFHVQFRPLGRKNSGGSFYQFNSPHGYDDNSTLIPDRYWFEAELFSLFGQALDDPFTPRDYHIVVGKFPMTMHNSLLMNDDIFGVAINKNTLYLPPFSNVNFQVFYGADDVDSTIQPSPEVVGFNTAIDYRHTFVETTLAYVYDDQLSGSDSGYAAGSVTQFFGPLSLAGRVLGKWGDDDGRGDGQLFVVESNYSRKFSKEFKHNTGFEHAVYYANAFRATSGWNSISGGNFDRIRSTFEVNPLVNISQFGATDDLFGAAMGVQLFRDDDNQSWTPEIAFEDDSGDAVFGIGLGWMKKVGRRTFVEARGIQTWSDNSQRERRGLFGGTTVVF